MGALCARIRAADAGERRQSSHLERVGRLLRCFEDTVHLPVVIYDVLDGRRLSALLVSALDRFAIDAADADVKRVLAATEKFQAAVRDPAIARLARSG